MLLHTALSVNLKRLVYKHGVLYYAETRIEYLRRQLVSDSE